MQGTPASRSIIHNAEVLPVREMCFSVAAITNVGGLISLYRLTMCRTIVALGNTKEWERGAFTHKDLILYLGRKNIYLQECWEMHRENTYYYWIKRLQELREGQQESEQMREGCSQLAVWRMLAWFITHHGEGYGKRNIRARGIKSKTLSTARRTLWGDVWLLQWQVGKAWGLACLMAE